MQIPVEHVTTQHEIRPRALTRVGITNWVPVTKIEVEVQPDGHADLFKFYLVDGWSITLDRGTKVEARASLPVHAGRFPATLARGMTGDDQQHDFANATLQSGGSNVVEYSIATYLHLPLHLQDDPDGAADYILRLFEWLAHTAREDGNDLTFDVMLGPAREGGNA